MVIDKLTYYPVLTYWPAPDPRREIVGTARVS